MSTQNDIPMQPFPATQWSLVDRAARESDLPAQRQALATILQRYLPALRAHLVAAKRIAPDRADDLLQGFVADKIIEQNLLAHAQQGKGKFRSFLLVTLNRYIIDRHRADTAETRNPTSGVAQMDSD